MAEEKRVVIGILAHVDAGKTTLAEGLMYTAGQLRRMGRVDHRDTFLDTDPMERERGITVFSKQALLTTPSISITLLDTPGHTDLSAEAERTLQVLDYAILVVSASEGVQSHTRTLYRLLTRMRVPTFLFINKEDLPNPGREALLAMLEKALGSGFVDFSDGDAASRLEALAMADEHLMDDLLERGTITDAAITGAIAACRLHPVCFGCALKLTGVKAFLGVLETYTMAAPAGEAFGARVFRISQDAQGARLTHLRVTDGVLRVKDRIAYAGPDGTAHTEKADQLRLYSGKGYTLLEEAPAGTVLCVTGLSATRPGMGLGEAPDAPEAVLEPVMRYQAVPENPADADRLGEALQKLGMEEPGLHVAYQQALHRTELRLMGEVQEEILTEILRRRFGLAATFRPAGIVYRETIAAPVRGCGHFEPLRHYAEVHLRLDPLPRGSGLRFRSECREDLLDRSWQNLILTHLKERSFPGALTGSPVTDIQFTLVAGRAHLKHTEGGDFRQATYRAVRQGLRSAETVLLEPWYAFTLTIPQEAVGHAMADLTRLGATFSAPVTVGDMAELTGEAPVATLQPYGREVAGYTHGLGSLSCIPCGNRPCHNTAEVVEAVGYSADADILNTADSVFCSHGTGETVPWDEAPARMHIVIRDVAGRQEAEVSRGGLEAASATPVARPSGGSRSTLSAARSQEDRELERIFERTYGAVRRDAGNSAFRPTRELAVSRNREAKPAEPALPRQEYLLVDGYNIIFAWEELALEAGESLDAARAHLTDLLASYRAYHGGELILVFDAYRVHGSPGSVEKTGGITVVYTREAETADAYIVKASYELARGNLVRVATSDSLEQLIILSGGALRVSAREFHDEVMTALREIRSLLPDRALTQRLEITVRDTDAEN